MWCFGLDILIIIGIYETAAFIKNCKKINIPIIFKQIRNNH